MSTSAHLTITKGNRSIRMRRHYDGYPSCAGVEVFEAAQRAAKNAHHGNEGEEALSHVRSVTDSRERSSWQPTFDGTRSGIEHFYVIRAGVYGVPHGIEIQHVAVPIGGELGDGHELTTYTLAEWREHLVSALQETNERLREINAEREENGQEPYELHDLDELPAAYVELSEKQRALLAKLEPHDRSHARNAWMSGGVWDPFDFVLEEYSLATQKRIVEADGLAIA